MKKPKDKMEAGVASTTGNGEGLIIFFISKPAFPNIFIEIKEKCVIMVNVKMRYAQPQI